MDGLSLLPHGDALLGNTAFITGDEGIGGIHYILGGAVVSLQAEEFCPGEILLEIQDVLDLGAAEAIDGLGVVSHHADVPVPCSQLEEDEVLGHVCVLVLVHKDMVKAGRYILKRLRRLLKEDIHIEENIVEVHDAGLLAKCAVGGIDAVNLRLFLVAV